MSELNTRASKDSHLTEDEEDFRQRLLRALSESDEMRRERRADRIIWLSDNVPSFGLLSGPMDTLHLIEEARTSYIDGHFVAALLTALSLIERLIISELKTRGVQCWKFEVAIRKARENTSLSADLLARSDGLRLKRNAFIHPRPENDPNTFGNRFLAAGQHPDAILEEDAQEAVALMYAFLRVCVRPGKLPTIDRQIDS